MRNLTKSELAQTNGGCTLTTLFGNCPYEAHIAHSVVGAVSGALYSHVMLGNGQMWQYALGGAALVLAVQIGGNIVLASNSTAA